MFEERGFEANHQVIQFFAADLIVSLTKLQQKNIVFRDLHLDNLAVNFRRSKVL